MKRAFLFDASAVAHYYISKPAYEPILAYLMSVKHSGEGMFFIPSFCIAETLNTFAKYHYRFNLLDKSLYEEIRDDFVDKVHNRKVFYSYDLNRYHNLNAEEVFLHEHTLNTEFDFVNGEKPKGATVGAREADLDRIRKKLKDLNVDIRKHYLSTFDILLIGMARELKRFFGESNTFLVTKDQRIYTVCKDGKLFNKVIYLPATKLEDLKARLKVSN